MIIKLFFFSFIYGHYYFQINASLPLNTSLAHHSISGVSSRVLVNGSFESLKNYTDDASSKVCIHINKLFHPLILSSHLIGWMMLLI